MDLVCDHDHGGFCPEIEARNKMNEFFLPGKVQSGGRFVQKEQIGFLRDKPGNLDLAAFPTREFPV